MKRNPTPQPNYDGVVNRIISDVYQGMVNLGLVSDYIPAGNHTADFDINDDYKVRIKEQGNNVYYSIFRAK